MHKAKPLMLSAQVFLINEWSNTEKKYTYIQNRRREASQMSDPEKVIWLVASIRLVFGLKLLSHCYIQQTLHI